VRDRQQQKVGEQSVAIQSANDTHYHAGTSEARAYEIAEHVAVSYLERFERTAYLVAASRVDQLRTELIDRISSLEQEHLKAFEEPDVQMLILEAQKGYARSGSPEQKGTLVDLVAARCAVETGSLRALAINGAVEAVTKLSRKAIDTVTIVWLATRFKYLRMVDRSVLASWAETNLNPFAGSLTGSNTIYELLEATGCGAVSVLKFDLREILGKGYLGIFQSGFSLNEISPEITSLHDSGVRIYVPTRYPAEDGKYQIAFTDNSVARKALESHGVSEDLISTFCSTMEAHLLPVDDIERILRGAHPAWAGVLDELTSTVASNFRLSVVGNAIAHCRFTNVTGDPVDLSIWIPDS